MIEVARLFRLENNGSSLKAFVDVIVAEGMVIKGLRIVQGKKGLFVAMPTQKSKDGKWHNIVDVFDPELREELQQAVLESYNV